MARSDVAGVVVAATAAIALAAFGIVRGTWAVGGSDSSCYALTALAMAEGRLQPVSPFAAEAPWPNAPLTLAPGGFIPSPVRADAASPICAPGMAVLMAPMAMLFGRDAIFWLVPLSSVVLVMACFFIAREIGGATAGVVAAVLIASSPIVLYQVVQPMNDVLTAALWMAAFALAMHRQHFASGLLAGVAILVRPNLAPLMLALAASPLVLQHARAWRATSVTVAAAVPGGLAMLALNNALYGGAFASGYGDASRLFSASNIDDNLVNFGGALLETQYLVPMIGLAAPTLFTQAARRLSVWLITAALTVIAIYAFYQPYPEWWYIRFLMPAIALLLALTGAVMVHAASRARMGGLVPITAVVLAILGIRTAADRQAFDLQALEGRYRTTAQIVSERLPSNAALITVWQSGSVRFHADREAVMWDSMDPGWLDRAVAWLSSRGRPPYLLLERREEGEFRSRFRGHSEYGALDWPPRLDINRQVRIYDPADRARYLAGEAYATDNVRPR
jgi:hypothetical protein